MADPTTMTARALQDELASYGVTTADCLDKNDLITKLTKVRANPPKKQDEAPSPAAASPTAARPQEASKPSARPGNAKQRAEIQRILRTKDFYAVLKVEKTAEQSEIHKAYRKLALLLHPDKCQEPQSEEAFKMVSRAYDTLSNKREQYDLTGDDSDRAGGMNAAHFDPNDLFREVFGAGFGAPGGGGFQFHQMPGGVHFTFGPGGGMGGGRRRRRGDGQQQQGPPNPLTALSPMLFLFLLPLLPVLLPLLTAFVPYLLLFCLVQALSR